MDQSGISKALQEIGLPEKAALIYISLLGKQKMTVSEIARESNIKRATCYEYLDLLLNKDFVVRVPVGKRMFYAAVEPKKVLSDFKKKAAHFEQKINEMAAMHDVAVNKPRIVFYEGKREIKNIYEDIFKTAADVYSIFPPLSFFENFTEEDYDEYDKLISSYALKSRDLFIVDKYYKKIKEIRDKNSAEGKNKLDKKLPAWFQSNVDVLIYADKVALISLRDLSAIVIENRDIADLFRNMHSFMWKSL
ncbi:MAG TPA: helix-turn-helix domain-containing protein [Candidatus Paceibacterota bacterium]